jgi:hypothetical protein
MDVQTNVDCQQFYWMNETNSKERVIIDKQIRRNGKPQKIKKYF